MQLIERAMQERQQRAKDEKMSVEAAYKGAKTPWGDYVVTSKLSGKSYRVALRGTEPGESFCTCPDYRTNTLGTCKHILHALNKIRRRFDASAFRRKPRQKETNVYLKYGVELALRLNVPDKVDEATSRVLGPVKDVDIQDVNDLLRRIDKLEGMGESVVVYPDAEEYIQQQLFRQRISGLVEEIRKNPAKHPLRKTLLKTELLPYQMDGIAFAAGAGRAILARQDERTRIAPQPYLPKVPTSKLNDVCGSLCCTKSLDPTEFHRSTELCRRRFFVGKSGDGKKRQRQSPVQLVRSSRIIASVELCYGGAQWWRGAADSAEVSPAEILPFTRDSLLSRSIVRSAGASPFLLFAVLLTTHHRYRRCTTRFPARILLRIT